MRTGALLTAIGLVRLARIARQHWRLSFGLAGVLSVVLGHSVLTGQAGVGAGLAGMVVLLVAVLKSEDRAPSRLPQAGWGWRG